LTHHSIGHSASTACWIRPDATFAYVNDATCQLLGYSRDELLNMAVFDVDADWSADYWFTEGWDRVKEAGSSRFETRARRRNGSIIPVEVKADYLEFEGQEYVFAWVSDITERKLAEEALRESEARYRGVFEAAQDGLEIFSIDGTIREANPAACAMHGYSYDEFVGLPGWDIVHRDSHHLFEEFLEESSAGRPFYAEAKNVHKDGSTINIEVVGAPFVFQGEPHALAVVHDITERKRAEEALRLTQRSVDHSATALFWVRPDGTFVYANDAACQLMGYSRDELQNMAVYDVDPDWSADYWFSEGWDLLKEAGSTTIEARGQRRDGTIMPVEIKPDYLEFEGQEYVFAWVSDITERKQAEEALRESEARYRGVFEAAQDGLGFFSIDGIIREANPAACAMHGYSYGEFVGLHGREVVHPDSYHLFEQLLEETAAGRSFYAGHSLELCA